MSKSALLTVPVAVAIVIGAAVGGCRDVSFRLANRTGTQATGGAAGGLGRGGDTSFGGGGGGDVGGGGDTSFGGGGGGAGGATVATGGQGGGDAGGAAVIAMGGAGQPACTDPLTFADPDVEAQVRQAIGVPTGPIHPADVVGLTDLNLVLSNVPPNLDLSSPLSCGNSSLSVYYDLSPSSTDSLITSLAGVECLPSVQRVWLDPICVDLGPLAQLPNLTGLWFGPTLETKIPRLPGVTILGYVAATSASTSALLRSLPSLKAIGGGLPGIYDFGAGWWGSLDFSYADERAALAELTNLTQLELFSGSDISFVSGLAQLTKLVLGYGIQDISALADLTGLTSLDLSDNKIQDISALSGLVGLVHLVLDNNPIRDLAPLVANPGLGTGDDVSILNANLNCAQQQNNIAALRSRGVTLKTDCP